jgi:diguanylate cyclase (GGDEF)-like protein/PAS domain S-box-containing protein
MVKKKNLLIPKSTSESTADTRFQRLFDNSQDGILLLDAEKGKIIDVNPFLVKMLGYSHTEFVGHKPRGIGSFKKLGMSPVPFQEIQKRKQTHIEDLPLKTKNGQRIHVRFTSATYRVGDETVIQCNFRDITEQKQLKDVQDAGYQIVMAAETTQSLIDLYPKIHQIISSVMPAENFFIVLYDEKRNKLTFPYFKNAKDEPYLGELEPGKGLTAYVLRTGKSLLCTQAIHDELERKGAVKLLGVPSAIWLGVPLFIEGKTIGAMVVQDYSDPKAYGEREQYILEFVSSQVAVAISRKQVEDTLRESDLRLQNAERVSHLGSWEMDITTRKCIWSEEFFHICGFEPNEVEPNLATLLERIHPDDRDIFSQALHQAIDEKGAFSIEQRLVHPDGNVIWVNSIGQVVSDGGNAPAKLIGSFLDITTRKQAQALEDAVYQIAIATEMTKSLNDLFPRIHEIISSVMPAENFFIVLYDEQRNVLTFPYFKDALDEPYLGEIEPGKGLTAYVLRTGKSLLCTQAVHDELERQGAVKLLGVPSAIWLGVPLIIEGKPIGAMVVQHYTDPDAYGEREQHMLEYVSTEVAIAITRKQTEDKLKLLSTHDMLTGLFSRGYFEEEMARLEHSRQFPVSVIMADVDQMKETNDREGHAAGDTLLKRFAQVLTAAFRAEDVVARIGGDEFCVLLPNTNEKAAQMALNRVRRILKEHNSKYSGAALQVSLGVSTAEKFIPLTEVLKHADRNMYTEKKARYNE